ncbi:MAG: 2-oxo acid dehydrogenase subunit E2 [Streptosporangiales bacterium]|nr:2-oxo acid dehydrogenase subunit E2 [Streptosporangiales bacterium]MBO0889339.1 2-oxo acid dehydrogenase subunit E2 [Acidothermales bacterium]
MGLKRFKLPDTGEGLTEGEVLQWLVEPGDVVTVNQNLVEIETAKAVVELPSPWAGTVRELYAEEGSTVDVGTPIIAIDVPAEADDADAGEGGPTSDFHDVAGEGSVPEENGRTSVLVGYGPKATSAKRRPRRSAAAAAAAPAAAAPTESVPAPVEMPAASVTVLAKPPVRKLARDLGVDLRSVTPTGPNGSVSREDVTAAAEAGAEPAPAAHGGPGLPMTVPANGWVPELSFDNAAREARIPVRGVRRHTAAAMVRSAFTAPHVTEFVTVDATRTMDLVRRLKTLPEFEGVKVSPLLLVAKAVLLAIRRSPIVNSRWDEQAQEIAVRGYVNLGIAAATPRGLVVPNVRDADALSLPGLAAALQHLTDVARSGRTPPADMQGGTFTITNVGVFGVDSGTPILNPGEAGILAVGAVREQPWVHDGQVVPRRVTTLGLSFDHRIVDGEQGSRFLRDVADFVEDPETRLFAWT